jgi:integrase/recombinase XerD
VARFGQQPGQPAPNRGMKLPGEVLTPDEIRALLRQCSHRAPTGVRDRALITVMYRAALRVSEALALKVSDVDMKHGTVHVRNGKGGKARTVAIGDGALAVLQLWLDARKRALEARGLTSNGRPLFCTLEGGPLSDDQVRGMLKRRAARAGIEKRVHPHALRHSRAFELSQQGRPVNLIQQQLGHARLSTTDTYLRHIAPADVIALGRADDWTE